MACFCHADMYPHGLKSLSPGDYAVHNACTLCNSSSKLPTPANPDCDAPVSAAETTVEKTLKRLGTSFEMVPLPSEGSMYVKPAAVMFELDGEHVHEAVVEWSTRQLIVLPQHQTQCMHACIICYCNELQHRPSRAGIT